MYYMLAEIQNRPDGINNTLINSYSSFSTGLATNSQRVTAAAQWFYGRTRYYNNF